MSIQDIVIKIKGVVGEENLCKIRLFLPIGISLVSILLLCVTSFLMGSIHQNRLRTIEKRPVTISLPDYLKPYKEAYGDQQPSTIATVVYKTSTTTTSSVAPLTKLESGDKSFVTSKSGKVYYPSGCAGINRIKPENRVYYTSSAELIARGYTLSKTCK